MQLIRHNARWAYGGGQVSGLELRIAPDVIWLLTAALMWLSSALTRDNHVPIVARIAMASLCFCAGIALVIHVRIELDRAHTTWHPSEPERSTSLVTSGPFRFSRNPMYLGMWLVLVGWAAVLQGIPALALTILFMLYVTRFQIVPEERALFATMGDEYREYASRVRRWL